MCLTMVFLFDVNIMAKKIELRFKTLHSAFTSEVANGVHTHTHTHTNIKRNSETNRKCNYCLSGHSIRQQYGQFHSNFSESTGRK